MFRRQSDMTRWCRYWPHLVAIALLALCNLHLVTAWDITNLIYTPQAVRSGQWYRLISHIFTHVSGYHLMVDATATAILLSCLPPSNRIRIPAFFFCSAGALAGVTLFSPELATHGYCGLSGTAHGLMAFTACLWLREAENRTRRLTGSLFLLASLGKGITEVLVNSPLLISVHGGEIGIPLVQAHLGGAVAGVLFFFLTDKHFLTTHKQKMTIEKQTLSLSGQRNISLSYNNSKLQQ